jgi:hypothetical protein
MPRILHKLECRRTPAGAAANLWALPIEAKGRTAMRKSLRVSILVLALSGAAYAGDIPNDSPAPPTAPATASTTTEPTGGEPVDAQAAQITAAEIAVGVLQSVMFVL